MVFRLPSQRTEEHDIRAKSEHHMRFMNVWQYRNELAKNLPYGDQRRVEIARALATDLGSCSSWTPGWPA